MRNDYYSEEISNFLNEDSEAILGKLLVNDTFETTDLQKNAWRDEIDILKQQLTSINKGDIVLE